MFQVRKGLTSKPIESDQLGELVSRIPNIDGILYVGYPILFGAGQSTTIDALLISKKYGVVIFDIAESDNIDGCLERQDLLFKKLESMLIQYPSLNNRRTFLVKIEAITFAPHIKGNITSDAIVANDISSLSKAITEQPDWGHSEKFETVVSIIQNVVNLKTRINRDNVKNPGSRGGKLKELESKISNLDEEQERAVIEFFDGVQRIRGLAGSGKTIVLALKAAYLHTQHPNWDIAVTFFTRALKQQFRDLIERFCIEKKGELSYFKKLWMS